MANLSVTSSLHRIESLVRLVLKGQEIIMKGEDDLKAALAANAQAIKDVTASINTKIAALVAAANGDNDDDVEALAQQLTAETAQLNLAVSNAVNPPADVTPGTGGAAVATSQQTGRPVQGGTMNDPANPAAATSPTPPAMQPAGTVNPSAT